MLGRYMTALRLIAATQVLEFGIYECAAIEMMAARLAGRLSVAFSFAHYPTLLCASIRDKLEFKCMGEKPSSG